MRKLLTNMVLLLAAALAVAGCEKIDDSGEPVENRIVFADDASIIYLSESNPTGEFAFTVDSSWHIEISGKGLTVDPSSGGAGYFVVTVSAADEYVAGRSILKIILEDTKASREVSVVCAQSVTEKTIIAYYMGTDLRYYFDKNVSDMRKAVINDALGVNARLVQFRQLSSSNAEIKEMVGDGHGKSMLLTVGSVDIPYKMTAELMAENLRKIMDYAPAKSYTVIFLGHSTAWLPSSRSITVMSTDGYVPSMDKMPGAPVTRTVGENNVELSIVELAEALKLTGEKIDCLYFDVCFMSSLEAVYELRDVADYVIASPCEIMGAGSPYDIILAPLVSGDYERVCRKYCEFYNSYPIPSGCIATVDCSKLDAVADVVKRINTVVPAEDFDISNVQGYEGRSDHWFFDAEDYYRQICAEETLVEELKERLAECVLWRNHTKTFFSAFNNSDNAISYYSGISLTPDEMGIDSIVSTVSAVDSEIASINSRLGELDEEDENDKVLIDELKATLRPLNSKKSTLNTQKKTLEYYNPSLRNTLWYVATH